ncbi:transposase family protein [Saccharopolyspora sp. NPDC002376]
MPAGPSCLPADVARHLALLSLEVPDSGKAPDRLFDLRECFAGVVDPRCRRGVRHSLVSILGIAASAVATGVKTFTAIAEWAADAPADALERLGVRRDPRGGFQVPDEATIRRVLSMVDGDSLDTAVCAWLAAHPGNTAGEDVGPEVIAVDGKSLRGTYPRTGETHGVRLTAALSHRTGVITGQKHIPAGKDERGTVLALLDDMNLAGINRHRRRPAHDPPVCRLPARTRGDLHLHRQDQQHPPLPPARCPALAHHPGPHRSNSREIDHCPPVGGVCNLLHCNFVHSRLIVSSALREASHGQRDSDQVHRGVRC